MTDNAPVRANLPLDETKLIAPQLSQLSEPQLAQILRQANQWADYTQYTALMNEIAQSMREIPVLPSEQPNPKDTTPLLKVEFPPDGGVLTWMEKYDFPYRGYPHYEFVEKIDVIKKMSRGFLSGLYHQFRSRNPLRFITLLPALWVSKDLFRTGLYVIYRAIERFRIKEARYSKAIRELYRAFGNGAASDGDFRRMLRDVVCMILEFDNAYRFRAQDILAELNKTALAKNPRRELNRLLDILIARENQQEIRDTWTLFRYVIRYYLLFDRKLLAVIAKTLWELDLKKVSLSVEDKLFCLPRKDYHFGFMIRHAQGDLADEHLFDLKDVNDQFEADRKAIEKESTEAHTVIQENGNDKGKLGELDRLYEKKIVDLQERTKNKKQLVLTQLAQQSL